MVDRMKYAASIACMFAVYRGAAAQDHLFGVNRDADIVRYDTATGECAIISDNFIGPGDTWSMARDASGRIFVGSTSRVYEVFPNGIVEYENFLLTDMRAMAFEPGSDTIVYASNRNQTRTDLWKIDISIPGNSQRTRLGNQGQFINGLVFSPNGTLYGWSNNIGLVTVDTLTGAVIDVNPAVAAPDTLQSLAFDSNGTMWGAGNALFTVDPATGVTTAAGNAMCLDVQGIEFSDGLCYADCDTSTGPRFFDLFDFLCFQSAFVGGEPFACDCDVSTGLGVCDVFDFLCFQGSFVSGCP